MVTFGDLGRPEVAHKLTPPFVCAGATNPTWQAGWGRGSRGVGLGHDRPGSPPPPPQKGSTCGTKHEPCTIYHLTSALGIPSANYFCINLGLAVGIIDALFHGAPTPTPGPHTTLSRGKRIVYGDKTICLTF